MHRHLRPSARKSRISRTGMSSERDQCRNNHQISHRLTPVRTKSPARDLHGVRGDPVVIEGHARDHPARSRTQRGALEIRSPNDSIAFRDARSWRRRRHYVPESKIDARRHSRGHLRHLMPPEALGLAGHDKPVPHVKVNRKRVLRSPVPEPKPACCPERQARLLSDSSQGQAHRRCAIQRCRVRFEKGCIVRN